MDTNSLHRIWLEPTGGWLNLAHRGARSIAPENTMAAAEAGLAAGADGWELDVVMTADRHPVVMHDNSLARTTDAPVRYPTRRPWRVSQFALHELMMLEAGSWFASQDPFGQIASGKVDRQTADDFTDQRIPTLRQALEFSLANQWPVNVELKDLESATGGEVMVRRVVALVAEMEMHHLVLVSSFNHDYLRLARSLDRNLALGVLMAFEAADPLGHARMLGAQTYHPRWDLITGPQVQDLRQAGLGVMPYTVNDPERARLLLDWGATGIFTDFPQKMRSLKDQLL